MKKFGEMDPDYRACCYGFMIVTIGHPQKIVINDVEGEAREIIFNITELKLENNEQIYLFQGRSCKLAASGSQNMSSLAMLELRVGKFIKQYFNETRGTLFIRVPILAMWDLSSKSDLEPKSRNRV